MLKRKKPYDNLPEIPHGTRPLILLTGNGINLSFEGAKKTDSIIQEEWKKNYGKILPDSNDKNPHEIWKLPLPQQVVIATKDHVQGCMTELSETFKRLEVLEMQKAFIKTILDTGFDVILSTNYSLEFEKSTIKECTQNKIYSCYRTTKEQTPQQKKFGIFQCTELPFSNHPLLWHIHGSALRKNSMVMGQFYYGKLLSEITVRADKVNTEYRKTEKAKQPFQPMSWIDYLLIGDVHIFGLQLDYSENDLWWLLSYKKSAFPESRTYYYSEIISKEKQLMLDCYDIKTPYVPFNNREKSQKHIKYYKRICSKILENRD